MKRLIVIMLLTLLAILLECRPGAFYTLYGIRPEITLILLVFLAGNNNWHEVLILFFVIGFGRDLFGLWAFGYYSAAYLLLGCLVSSLRHAVYYNNIAVQAVAVFVASAMLNFGAILLQLLTVGGSFGDMLIQGLMLSTYNALAAPVVFFLLDRFKNLLVFKSLWKIGRVPGQPRANL